MLREKLGKTLLLFDGAMGTQLQKRGLKPGELPEAWNLTHTDRVQAIHEDYLKAGSDMITTNTFGANRKKLSEEGLSVTEVIQAALRCADLARQAVGKEAYVIQDIGPIGELLEPLGELSFDEAYDIVKEQVLAGRELADAFLLETMTDPYELKAAILAVKENSDLPVFASMTFESNGRTLSGCDPVTFVTIAEGLGADALGINCSLGPKEMSPIISDLLTHASVPVLIQPNAGLPVIRDGEAVYTISPEEFVEYARPYVFGGASMVGGCCGTTPEFIRGLRAVMPDTPARKAPSDLITRITGTGSSVALDGSVIVCGERLNPTGKKKLKEALKEGRLEEYVKDGILQVQAGAKALDVNVGLPGIDEAETMKKVVRMLQEVITVPLQIDSALPEALEAGCRYYNGKPIINSVNGKPDSMAAVFPIAKKYGACVVGLTLDDEIPSSAEERVAIARRIIETAESYGIPRRDILIDCLTLTASAAQKEVMETLRALKICREELGVHTVLGVSNVSFGLPERKLLNRTFLTMAMLSGLDFPIINPLDSELMETILAFNVLTNRDPNAETYISQKSGSQGSGDSPASGDFSLYDLIISGIRDGVKEKTKELIQEHGNMYVIDQVIIPALAKVGDEYQSGRIFLPRLIQSAEATKAAFEVVNETFADKSQSTQSRGPVVLCTVEGDIHDIGKNIVKTVLESYGYRIIDLGKNVPAKEVVRISLEEKPLVIGLSALMTTTVSNMKRTIADLREAGVQVPIWVGGAVLTKEIADGIGADYYTSDAMASVELLGRLLPSK